MPEDDHFKDDFNSYFWLTGSGSFAALVGLENKGFAGWVWLGIAGLAGLIWLSSIVLGGSIRDKRKTHQRALPWAIWGVLGAIVGVGVFIALKAAWTWLVAANLSPASQIVVGMLAVIIVQLLYINLELERIRKRPLPTNDTSPR